MYARTEELGHSVPSAQVAANLKMLLKGEEKKASEESVGRYCVLGQPT